MSCGEPNEWMNLIADNDLFKVKRKMDFWGDSVQSDEACLVVRRLCAGTGARVLRLSTSNR